MPYIYRELEPLYFTVDISLEEIMPEQPSPKKYPMFPKDSRYNGPNFRSVFKHGQWNTLEGLRPGPKLSQYLELIDMSVSPRFIDEVIIAYNDTLVFYRDSDDSGEDNIIWLYTLYKNKNDTSINGRKYLFQITNERFTVESVKKRLLKIPVVSRYWALEVEVIAKSIMSLAPEHLFLYETDFDPMQEDYS